MHLKRLTLKGFKSFAETTVLDLRPGITVVVGPNGSGKSNIVEAVAWVLGAQGPSTVRSSKMEEVIFAGAGHRPGLGRAEVSLTVDNDSGRLPLGSEVTVSRTLWRSGESEYAINGSPCRLLDVQDLLSDTGVGRKQHVIVGQGQVDWVLSARPDERRQLIEEAAGILKYRRRRERTGRRIASTEVDLARVEDLIREVRSQLRPLQRQAEAARRREALVAELRAGRLWLAGQDLAEVRSHLQSARQARGSLEALIGRIRQEVADADQELEDSERMLADEGQQELGQLIAGFGRLAERTRGVSTLVEERRRSLTRLQRSLADEAAGEQVEAEAERLRLAMGETAGASKVLDESRAELQARAGLADELGALTMAQQSPELVLGGGQDQGELRGRHATMSAAVERDREEHGRAQRQLALLESRIAELSAALSKDHARTSSCRAQTQAAEEELESVSAAAARVDAATLTARGALDEARANQDRWSARVEALEMALGQLKADRGIEAVPGVPGALGWLADLIVVEPGWEVAVEAALGRTSSAVVLADSSSAREALQMLSDLHRRVVLLVPVVRGTGGSPESPSRSAAAKAAASSGAGLTEHVSSELPAVSALVQELLQGVQHAGEGWVEALERASARPDLVFVTDRGDRFGPDGWVLAGSGAAHTSAALARAQEGARAANDLNGDAMGRWTSAQADLDRSSRALQEATRRRAAAAAILKDCEQAALSRQVSLDQAGAEASTLRGRVRSLQARLDQGTEQLGGVQARLASMESAQLGLNQRRAGLARRMAGLAGDQERIVGELRSVEIAAAGMAERSRMLGEQIGQLEEGRARASQAREETAARLRGLEGSIGVVERLSILVSRSEADAGSQLAILGDLRDRRAAAQQESRSRAQALRRLRAARAAEIDTLHEQLQQVAISEAEARVKQQAVIDSLEANLGATPQEAATAERPQLAAGSSLVARASELERELRQSGPVNPLAVDELAALTQRLEMLEGQLADVHEARRELAKLLSAIDDEMASVFAQAFDEVAAHFAGLVGALFTGGAGHLVLTQADQPLEAGIEITARPAGKRVRSIGLLSGGERSLVALAFLFAVFRARPSPFYLLDEVEAALDDLNLARFLGLLDEFRAGAQIVIVSHQRRTMEIADWLIGVSISEGGSSRVVSEQVA